MANLSKIKRNVRKMVSLGAPEKDIDAYIASEGTTIEAIQSFRDTAVRSNIPQQKLAEKFIPQVTKALYENLPFGKRVIGALPNAAQIQANLQATPPPKGFAGKAGAITGAVAPNLAVSAPILKGAGFIPKVPGLVKSAIGLGVAGGVQAAGRNEPIIPATAKGAATGLAFGAAGKAGASLIPRQIPGAERIGSALGGAAVGAVAAPEGEKLKGALLTGGLGAIAPSKRINVLNKAQIRVNNAIDQGISKGIRPSVSGKRTFTQAESAKNNQREAVKTIVENKEQIQLNTNTGILFNRNPITRTT